MAKEGAQIILLNDRREVLMYLRDDFAHIPFPNMWALPGGMLEARETPKQCVIREIEEEMGVELDPGEVQHVVTHQRDFGIEHTFFAQTKIDIDDVVLTEGQRLGWFSEHDATTTQLAYADNAVLAEFYSRLPDSAPAAP